MEGVVGAPVVDVVAEGGDEEGEPLEGREPVLELLGAQEEEAEVGDAEGVRPVVVRHVSVALPKPIPHHPF